MPNKVKIYEVGPRDGLQNEKRSISASVKIELVERLADAGLRYIEAGAFVSPQWVPQMADTAAVFAGIKRKPDVTYAALVPNEKGMEAALVAGVREVAIFAAASETFSQKNINCSIAESIERFRPVVQMAKKNGVTVRGYVSCIAGCPYEGEIAPGAVADVAEKLYGLGSYEISLGDTIGVGTPETIRAALKAVAQVVPVSALALHCHDTHGRALDNIREGLERSVRVFDSSVGGLGGCPYAAGASGNVATEKVVGMMHGMGLRTETELDRIVETARWISDHLNENKERSRGKS